MQRGKRFREQLKTVHVSFDVCENSVYYLKIVIIVFSTFLLSRLRTSSECAKVKFTYVGRSWSIIIIIGAAIVGRLSAPGRPVSRQRDEEDFKKVVDLYICLKKHTPPRQFFPNVSFPTLINFFNTFKLGKYFRFS